MSFGSFSFSPDITLGSLDLGSFNTASLDPTSFNIADVSFTDPTTFNIPDIAFVDPGISTVVDPSAFTVPDISTIDIGTVALDPGTFTMPEATTVDPGVFTLPTTTTVDPGTLAFSDTVTLDPGTFTLPDTTTFDPSTVAFSNTVTLDPGTFTLPDTTIDPSTLAFSGATVDPGLFTVATGDFSQFGPVVSDSNTGLGLQDGDLIAQALPGSTTGSPFQFTTLPGLDGGVTGSGAANSNIFTTIDPGSLNFGFASGTGPTSEAISTRATDLQGIPVRAFTNFALPLDANGIAVTPQFANFQLGDTDGVPAGARFAFPIGSSTLFSGSIQDGYRPTIDGLVESAGRGSLNIGLSTGGGYVVNSGLPGLGPTVNSPVFGVNATFTNIDGMGTAFTGARGSLNLNLGGNTQFNLDGGFTTNPLFGQGMPRGAPIGSTLTNSGTFDIGGAFRFGVPVTNGAQSIGDDKSAFSLTGRVFGTDATTLNLPTGLSLRNGATSLDLAPGSSGFQVGANANINLGALTLSPTVNLRQTNYTSGADSSALTLGGSARLNLGQSFSLDGGATLANNSGTNAAGVDSSTSNLGGFARATFGRPGGLQGAVFYSNGAGVPGLGGSSDLGSAIGTSGAGDQRVGFQLFQGSTPAGVYTPARDNLRLDGAVANFRAAQNDQIARLRNNQFPNPQGANLLLP